MASKYHESQRTKLIDLINSDDAIFYGGKSGEIFMGKSREFVLVDNEKNLFKPICEDTINYFKMNDISWWGRSKPTGHVLSSQIACINHLFQIRNDKEAVLT